MSKDKLLKAIEEKYKKLGVPLDSMLEGLLWSTPITYWDYIQTDALLGLQIPRTDQPDEMVFIMYHQVNELLFKMVLWEIDQVAKTDEISAEKFSMHLMRISRYFDMLSNSFTVMADGMERDQYLKFRNTLTPASGFQSGQYRKIEFASTELINLIDNRFRATIDRETPFEYAFEHLYWQAAGKDYKTGKKSYTLTVFEENNKDEFIRFAIIKKQYDLMVRSRALKIFSFLTICIFCFGCEKDPKKEVIEEEITFVEPQDIYEFGFNLNDYVVKRDTIKKGDSFGEILERNNIGYPHIFQIAEKAKDTFDIRKLQVGKPYTLLCSKDSLEIPKCFIYQPNVEEYVVVSFQDSIHAYTSRKPIKYVEKTVSGVIKTNISEALEEEGLSLRLAYKMADEIFAWTIDFRRLQKGDRFKVIYTDKFIDDTIYAGVQNVKAAYMEYNKEPFYAFKFETDSIKKVGDPLDKKEEVKEV